MKKNILLTIIFTVSVAVGQTFTDHNIANDVDQPRRIMPGDLDSDGDLDLVVITTSDPTPKIFCLENVNSSFNILDSVLIQVGYYDVRGLDIGDIDGDGDLDICATGKSDTVFAWWANDGNPFDGTAFDSANVLGTLGGQRIYNVDIADVDGVNGADLTVPYAIGDAVSYWENDGSPTPTFTERVINDHIHDNVLFAVWANVADVDNDGLNDVIATANDYIGASDSGRVTWFKNSGTPPDGETNAWSSTDINTTQRFPFVNWTMDLDRDGDVDVLVGANDGSGTETQTLMVYWNGGDGSSWTSTTISSAFDDAEYVAARDVDGDGDIDVIACNDGGDLQVFKNDGTNNFPSGDIITISSHYRGARTLYPADIDGDGDPDLVSVSLDGDSLDWWESDAEDKQLVTSGDSSLFWNNKVKIVFNSSSGGLDTTTVFYDSETVPNVSSVGSDVESVFSEGFYTITTDKDSYSSTLKFSYSNVVRWSNLGNENDLIICQWDGSNWIKAGTSQVTDTVNDTITVNEVSGFGRYALAKAKSVEADIVIFLEGPYDATGDSMYTALNTNNMIPLSQPFNTSSWNYSGTESVSTIPDNVVDWVLLELRSGTAAASKVSQRAAFVLKDGSVVDTDGISPVHFSNATTGSYYIVVDHRNHLSVMSASTVSLAAFGSATYNFSTSLSQFYGSDAQLLETGVYGMYTGDANGNNQVQTDDKNDIWKVEVGTSGYQKSDFNLNGQVQTDDKNDFWKSNVGRGTQVPN